MRNALRGFRSDPRRRNGIKPRITLITRNGRRPVREEARESRAVEHIRLAHYSGCRHEKHGALQRDAHREHRMVNPVVDPMPPTDHRVITTVLYDAIARTGSWFYQQPECEEQSQLCIITIALVWICIYIVLLVCETIRGALTMGRANH